MLKAIDKSDNRFRKLLNSVYHCVSKAASIEEKCEQNEEMIRTACNDFLASMNNKQQENDPISSSTEITCINRTQEYSSSFSSSEPQQATPGTTSDKETKTIENKLIKKLYRVIALECHPDKTRDTMRHKIFVYATDSKENLDVIQTLYLLSKTNVSDIELTDEEHTYILKKVTDINEFHTSITQTIFYLWQTMSEENKNEYIREVISNNTNKK